MNRSTTFITAVLLPVIISIVALFALLGNSIGTHPSSIKQKENFFNSPTYLGGQLNSVKGQVKINHLGMCVIESTDASVN
jgi:hypothetical protein